MVAILLTLQIFLVLILILLVFMQKSNGEGTANLTGGSNNFGKRKQTSFLNKITMYVAIAFMINSLALAKLSKMEFNKSEGIISDVVEKRDK